MKHLKDIFNKLDLSEEKGLFITKENKWKGLLSNRVEKLLSEIILPDAFFCIDNKPFILFFENLGKNKEQKLKQVWNFNEAPIIILCEKDSIEIYNGFNYLINKGQLQYLGGEEKLNDFSYFKLVTGQTWEDYQNEFKSIHRVNYYLLSNIKDAREILIKSLNPVLTNSLIGKIIFIRYLIDRKIKLNFEQTRESRLWSNQELCEILENKNELKNFFNYLKGKFNGESYGDLFPISDQDLDSIPANCLEVLVRLLSGDEIKTGQKSLFDIYDFSIIPVEFISNVYEQFVGEDTQEKQGSYYTPLFLVDYILSQTVDIKLDSQQNHSCKVLDPSCGSGVFLVETLRKLIEKYQENNPNYSRNSSKYKKDLSQIAYENIFGIDKDTSAVEVAIFSIYLTLLDYQSPSDIENFKFPQLYNKNFFCSDFFDLSADFNNVFKNLEFDFIIGNPPWKRGKGEEKNPLYNQYIEKRKLEEKEIQENQIAISNQEIAQAFVFRVSNFCTSTTKISLIITSKALYNLNAKGFRDYLLDNFLINKVFELSPVRREVFNNYDDKAKAIAPAAVLFYQYAFGQNTDKNSIEHISLKPSRFFSLFKIFTIQRNDFNIVSQQKLKEYDYLWKILVYGSYLDFNLIKRLKENYSSVTDIISDKNRYTFGQGIQVGGGGKNSALKHMNKMYIKAGKDIKPFWINKKTNNKWLKETVHRTKLDKPQLFEGPMILISKGFNKSFRSTSALLDKDAVFTDALTSISVLNKKDEKYLKIICGLLSSSLFAYLNLNTFSSSGIEREQAHNEEKFATPFVESKNIINCVDQLITETEIYYDKDKIIDDIDNEARIKQEVKKLDNTVLNTFSFSKEEIDLLHYSLDITIPMIMDRKNSKLTKPLSKGSQVFDDYIQIFSERLNPIFERMGKKLTVKIKYTKQIVGLFFKITDSNDEAELIEYEKSENSFILRLLLSLGTKEITKKLFIQKDVRGFEKDGFYIVKPNEMKLWHKAIAYLDVNEFADSILSKKNKSHV